MGNSSSFLLVAAVATSIGTAGCARKPGGAVKVEPKSGLEFVQLAGGTFHYGCEPQDTQCAKDEKPGSSMTMLAFWLGRTDATVAAYGKCFSAGLCTMPTMGRACTWQVPGQENHPINCIDWTQAAAFCHWIGGRLPTAEEWEYAAKGGESRIYPWGNEPPDVNKACFDKSCGKGTVPVDAYAGGASKDGLLNMVGNVWQWTASDHNSRMKEVRGGSWGYPAEYLRLSRRNGYLATFRYNSLGVRCVL